MRPADQGRLPDRHEAAPRTLGEASGGNRLLIALCLLAGAAFIVLYLLMVRTETGQDLDSAAHMGAIPAPGLGAGPASSLLQTISIGTLLLGSMLIAGIGFVRRGAVLALVSLAVIAISLILAEVFKHWVLERPDLLGVFDTTNSYPSGHTTIATGLGVAMLLVVPAWLRPAAAIGVVIWASAIGLASVAAGWHRPSDVVGAYVLTVGVAAVIVSVARITPRSWWSGGPERIKPVNRSLALGVVGLIIAIAVFAVFYNGRGLDLDTLDRGFLAYALLVPLAAAISIYALVRAAWGPRPSEATSDPARLV